MKNLNKFAILSLLLLCGVCRADGLSAASKEEISHLFTYLENSGCQFNRNGSWHEAKEAADHLNSKYQYLLGKDMISSAEDFIAKGAAQSSMSGQAYLVKCNNAAPVESAAWFQAELEKYRKSTLKVSGKR